MSLGTRLAACLDAAERLAALNISASVVDARFAKPIDGDLMLRMARDHAALITVEEGSVGGFGSQVMQVPAMPGRWTAA